MCQNCYLAKYYLKRKTKAMQKQQDKSQQEATIETGDLDSLQMELADKKPRVE
jgi:hypothetical protein